METMQSKSELNKEILKITMKIQDQHPELSKYIAEMPVSVPDESAPEITPENLNDYKESLNVLMDKYSKGV